MCGILFTNLDTSDEEFEASLKSMDHRGPDNMTFTKYNQYYLGHNRLKIIDLDNRSNQPFMDHSGEHCIIFNGEIYNYKELKERFNIKTNTSGDTEVLIEMYILLGEKMMEYINGMFSFVIFNIKTNEYFIARDRLGVKPLYYYRNGDKFVFSSEILPILKLINGSEIDEIGLRQYKKVRTFFREHTIYKDIKTFPAAHFMRQKWFFSRYWSLNIIDNFKYNLDEIKELVLSAINLRLISDVSVGCYLSGGLDSSIVAASAGQKRTYTVGFEDVNEFSYARLVAEKYNFIHNETLFTNEEFVYTAKKMILQKRDLLSVPNEVLLYKMTIDAKQFDTVILSGEGADELFCGYDRIYTWAAHNDFNLKEFDKLYSYGTHEDYEILDYILEPVGNIKNNLKKISVFFQLYHLHGLLKRLDGSTMMASVEARVPFCDYRLVEYMINVPFDIKMQNGTVKYILKNIFASLLPVEIIERPKVGFPVPLNNIFNNKCGMDSWLEFNIKTLFG